jgi:hypothetical protein
MLSIDVGELDTFLINDGAPRSAAAGYGRVLVNGT